MTRQCVVAVKRDHVREGNLLYEWVLSQSVFSLSHEGVGWKDPTNCNPLQMAVCDQRADTLTI